MSGGTPPHTTHDPQPTKICYSFHPSHDVEVEVIRCLRKSESVILIVRLPGGSQIAIPEWMLDPRICDQLISEDTPRISIDALMDLRRLIDAQSLSDMAVPRRRAESPTGGKDAQQRKTDRVATPTALRKRRDLERASRAGARTVPNAMAPTIDRGGEARRKEGE